MNITASIPRSVAWMDTIYTVQVSRNESGGTIGVFESVVPALGGPPVHVHHREDEVICVLEGNYEFWLDGRVVEVRPGSSIFLPRGAPHTFRVIGPSAGRNLTILTPGGLEEFFFEAAAQSLRIPVDMPQLLQLAQGYGIEFRGPANWTAVA